MDGPGTSVLEHSRNQSTLKVCATWQECLRWCFHLFPAPALLHSQTGLVRVCSPTCMTQPAHSRSSHTSNHSSTVHSFRGKRPCLGSRLCGQGFCGPMDPEQGLPSVESRTSLWDFLLCLLEFLALGREMVIEGTAGSSKRGVQGWQPQGWGNDGRHWDGEKGCESGLGPP